MRNGLRHFGVGIAAALVVTGTAMGTAAKADLTLTAAGAALFTISRFADGFPQNGTVGPLGIGFESNGSVIVSDDPGNVRVFPTDTDNQHAGSVTVGHSYGTGNAVGIVNASGNLYMTQQSSGNLVQINPNGTLNQLIVSGMSAATGAIANPNNGHVFVSAIGAGVIYDVDPIAQTKTAFKNIAADGLSITSNSLIAEAGGHVYTYDLSTAAQTFDSSLIPDGPDGAAIGFGTLAGNVFVNTNGGTVYEVNLGTHAQTLIASGGSRGDFVTVDPNGSLLVTQTSVIERLTPLAGGSFADTPEPGALALFASAGVCGLAGMVRRRRTRK